ncbi:MAG: hypothetical protein ACU0CA_00010 [Paracoccaceae bacterium]
MTLRELKKQIFVGVPRLGFTLCLVGFATQAGAAEYPVWDGYVIAPYGQIHLAYQSFDDGQKITSNIVDITNANSRIGFYINRADGGNGLSFQFESGLGLRPSSKTSQTNTPKVWDWSRRDLRQVQFIFKSGIGTFRLGQGSMPTDGVAQSDLGKTVVVAKSTIPEANGAYIFRTSTGALSDITIGKTFNNFDGARRMRLRYDSPGYGGFSIAVAYGQEVLKTGDDHHYYGFALNYEETFGDIRIQGAIGSSYNQSSKVTARTTAGSVTVLDQRTGLNLSVAAGVDATFGGQYVYLKAGWNTRLMSVGQTKFIVEGFQGTDYLSNASKSRMWGLAVIQEFDDQALEIYAGYRAFSYEDRTPDQYLDAGVVQIGARFRF